MLKICKKCERIIQEEADQCPDCQESDFKALEIVPRWLRDLDEDESV